MKTFLRILSGLVLMASTVLAVESNRTAPRPIETPMPEYPAELTDTGLNGSAVIELVVRADGGVEGALVKSADHPSFGSAALAVIDGWRFEPAMQDGAPVATPVNIPFRFVAPADQSLNALAKRKLYQGVDAPVIAEKDLGRKLKVKRKAEPVYPRAMRGSNVTERVRMKLIVAPDGSTLNPEPIGEPRKEFVLPAILAVSGMIFDPPVKDGQGVYVETVTTLTFAPPQARRPGGGGGGGGGFGGGDFGGGGFGGGGGGGGDD